MQDKRFVRSPIGGWIDLKPFKAWCCQILPTIFDDTMSYYETLCRVQEILNACIDDINLLDADLQNFKTEVANQFDELKNGTWVTESIKYVEALLRAYIPVGIYFSLTEEGYLVANIPSSWDVIQFGTTGLDIDVPIQPQYGHLVLSY